jgi:hypothetical protein
MHRETSAPVAPGLPRVGDDTQATPRTLRDYFARSRPMTLLTIPFIYGMAVPLLLLDAGFSAYQAACFPVYGIARVRRREHFVFDRARLPYLNAIQKAHCTYCSYANGVLGYAREITARTEQYWCPIKHARVPAGVHDRHAGFIDHGDGRQYEDRVQALRRGLAAERDAEAAAARR